MATYIPPPEFAICRIPDELDDETKAQIEKDLERMNEPNNKDDSLAAKIARLFMIPPEIMDKPINPRYSEYLKADAKVRQLKRAWKQAVKERDNLK